MDMLHQLIPILFHGSDHKFLSQLHGNCLGDVHEKKVLTCTKNHNVKRPTMHSWTYLFKDAYVAEDTAFVRAILDNTEVKATGHDGKMAVRIVRIGNESLKEKKIKKL